MRDIVIIGSKFSIFNFQFSINFLIFECIIDSKPKKHLGQNFLRDQNVINKIIDQAKIQPDETVLEVGPGQLAITLKLAERAKKVIAVEKDLELKEFIVTKLKHYPNVTVIYGDILKTDLPDEPYRVIANIPYYLTSPLLTYFLQNKHRPSSLILMVQKEIAEKLTSPKGNILSMLIAMHGTAKKLFDVASGAFYPAPKVTSSVISIALNPKPTIAEHQKLYELIKKCFTGKRKQLKNALKQNLHLSSAELDKLLNAAGIDGTKRAEELGLGDWERIYKV